jgi:hypothetical protein
MKKIRNMGTNGNAGWRSLSGIASPSKSGFTSNPKITIGTSRKTARIQDPSPTRQIKTLRKSSCKPALPSSIPVMITPATEAERAENIAIPLGITLVAASSTTAPPSAIARRVKIKIE